MCKNLYIKRFLSCMVLSALIIVHLFLLSGCDVEQLLQDLATDFVQIEIEKTMENYWLNPKIMSKNIYIK